MAGIAKVLYITQVPMTEWQKYCKLHWLLWPASQKRNKLSGMLTAP